MTLHFKIGAETFTVQSYITIDVPYVTGYIVDTVNGGPQPNSIEQITGLLVGENLELFVHTSRGAKDEDIVYLLIPGFNPSQPTQSGTTVHYMVNPPSVAAQGTVTLTTIN